MNSLLERLIVLLTQFRDSLKNGSVQPPVIPPMPVEPQIEPNVPPILLWDTKEHVRHSVRVLCDRAGLSFNGKQIVTACVYQESEFETNPKPNQNKDPNTGSVWSTDYGIVQVNDHFHIGPGKDFPSVEYVIDNPQIGVQWMIEMYKVGRIKMWSSYSTGAYVKWLRFVNTPCPPLGYKQ